MRLARACELLSTVLHVATLLLTIRALTPVKEPPPPPPVKRYAPCNQEALFNSYGTSSS